MIELLVVLESRRALGRSMERVSRDWVEPCRCSASPSGIDSKNFGNVPDSFLVNWCGDLREGPASLELGVVLMVIDSGLGTSSPWTGGKPDSKSQSIAGAVLAVVREDVDGDFINGVGCVESRRLLRGLPVAGSSYSEALRSIAPKPGAELEAVPGAIPGVEPEAELGGTGQGLRLYCSINEEATLLLRLVPVSEP